MLNGRKLACLVAPQVFLWLRASLTSHSFGEVGQWLVLDILPQYPCFLGHEVWLGRMGQGHCGCISSHHIWVPGTCIREIATFQGFQWPSPTNIVTARYIHLPLGVTFRRQGILHAVTPSKVSVSLNPSPYCSTQLRHPFYTRPNIKTTISTPFLPQTVTYDHRHRKTRDPVRSPIDKPVIGRLSIRAIY
jgi:hypothetical protein